jgi:hypothetical protein
MAKRKIASPDTNPAPRRRAAKKSAAETANPATGEPVARHRKAHPSKNSAPSAVAAVAGSTTQEDIARLAFSYFEQRGYQGGSPEDDWFRAEQELLQLVA